MSDGREIGHCLFDVSYRAKINTTTGTTLTFQLHSNAIRFLRRKVQQEKSYLTVDNKMFFINSPQPFCCSIRMLAHRENFYSN